MAEPEAPPSVLAIDAGGVLGVFESVEAAKAELAEFAGAIPGWGAALIPGRRALKNGDAVRFLFAIGTFSAPLAYGPPDEIRNLEAQFSSISIVESGDSEFYGATVGAVIPSARARLTPLMGGSSMTTQASEALMRIVAEDQTKSLHRFETIEPTLADLCISVHSSVSSLMGKSEPCSEGMGEAEPSDPGEADLSRAAGSDDFTD